jgi:alkylhydroperoxidase family enzyme
MARVPYFEERRHPELAELVVRVKAGRYGSLLNIYKLLLHAPELTEAWMALVDTMRRSRIVDGRTREIAIIRCAHANASAYEINQHVPRIALSEGLTEMEWQAIAAWPEGADCLSERDSAVVAYANALARSPEVPDAVFDGMAKHFTTEQIVELTLIISFYCMHARFIGALNIDLEPPRPS